MLLYTNKNTVIKAIVLFFDAIALTLCLYFYVWTMPENCPQSVYNHVMIANMLLLVTYMLFSSSIPLVIHNRVVTTKEILTRNAVVVILSQVVFGLLWHMMTRNSNNEMLFNLLFATLLYCMIVCVRLAERKVLEALRARGKNTRSVLFIGSDPANLYVYHDIMMDATTGYRVIGYYSNNEIEDAPNELKKLGTRVELIKMMEAGDFNLQCDEIYCSLSHDDEEDIATIMKFCNKHVVRFFYVPRMSRNIKLALKPQIVGGNVLFTNFYEPLTVPGNRIIKRAFDVFFSVVALIITLPFYPFIALMIKLQSKGPVFFTQERTGLDGKNFVCYKFRSMAPNDEADTLQATVDDPRKFPFGDFMRRTNIDELPQFINVLKGEMSIVGPRPHMLYHTEMYSKLLEKYMVRHFAKPGITGLAQVSGYRGETSELALMAGRIKKDIEYIENWSFWLDVKICFKTLKLTILSDEQAF
ncbi:MAG: undecaprenyl-phosphate glucose phosphotransferase [Prevotella sp.]|nr:undecaprenyl-phosphate glucose phosphotransferase [Prevotella sp.]